MVFVSTCACIVLEHYIFSGQAGCSCGSSGPLGSLARSGYSLSLAFTNQGGAEAFYDALACASGPSLDSNFTLACPYTVLAHSGELDWVAQYNVFRSLVCVSTGLEDASWPHAVFAYALKAAEDAHRDTSETNDGTTFLGVTVGR